MHVAWTHFLPIYCTDHTGVYPFAGKECSRALALMSTDEADCNGNLEGLGFTELDVLRDWTAKFTMKYPIVGNTKVNSS